MLSKSGLSYNAAYINVSVAWSFGYLDSLIPLCIKIIVMNTLHVLLYAHWDPKL